MLIVHFEPARGLIGGVIIGAASALLLLSAGRVAGISGIFAGFLKFNRGDLGWRAWFLAGLLFSGAAATLFFSSYLNFQNNRPLWLVALAGFLVGIGARISGGCTSGHGVCGVSRASIESIAATLTFMASGAAVIFALKGVLR